MRGPPARPRNGAACPGAGPRTGRQVQGMPQQERHTVPSGRGVVQRGPPAAGPLRKTLWRRTTRPSVGRRPQHAGATNESLRGSLGRWGLRRPGPRRGSPAAAPSPARFGLQHRKAICMYRGARLRQAASAPRGGREPHARGPRAAPAARGVHSSIGSASIRPGRAQAVCWRPFMRAAAGAVHAGPSWGPAGPSRHFRCAAHRLARGWLQRRRLLTCMQRIRIRRQRVGSGVA